MSARIAIVGMACRFPDAASPQELWNNMRRRRVSFRPIGTQRWGHGRHYHPSSRETDKTYVKNGAFIDDVAAFAALHFGIPPRRAEVMDPQQRLLLEVAHFALEDAGLQTRSFARKHTGVFIGASVSEYKDLMTVRLRAQQIAGGDFGAPVALDASVDQIVPTRAFSVAGGLLNMMAATVAQTFDFGGPAFTIDAACASALVAVAQGVSYLRGLAPAREGDSPVALVGGAYLNLTPDNLIGFSRIGAIAPESCRPFDADASGFIIGEGVGVVVLKRLSDAERDGDRVYAVIDGIAVNNDGRSEGPMTPRLEGQLDVLRAGLADAAVDRHAIGYFECHGTATAVGDRTELTALEIVFGGRPEPAHIGSIKANIGHTMSAAGIAGLMRAALSVHHASRLPQAGFARLHPQLSALADTFTIASEATPWSGKRAAGVSAFGFGGTNAFAVLSQAPALLPHAPARRPELFIFSAADPELLGPYMHEFATNEAPFAALAYTQTTLRALGAYAACVVASDHAELRAQIARAEAALRAAPDTLQIVAPGIAVGPVASSPAPLAFLYPGQGAQHANAFRSLFDRFAAFRAAVIALAATLDVPIVSLLFPKGGNERAAEAALRTTAICQPALAVLELALTRFLAQLGVMPHVVCGHSLGEFVAAAASDRIDMGAAVAFLSERGRAMARVPGSGMIAVKLAPEAAAEIAHELALHVANINHPEQTVLAGSVDDITRAADALRARQVAATVLQVSHGFHSPLVVAADAPIAALIDTLAIGAPSARQVSATKPGEYPATAAEVKALWRAHTLAPVDFLGAARALGEVACAVQVGPGRALSQSLGKSRKDVLTLTLGEDEEVQLLLCAGIARVLGHDVRLAQLFSEREITTTPLGPLARERDWAIAPSRRQDEPRVAARTADTPILRADPPHIANPPIALSRREETLVALVAKVSAFPATAITLEQQLGRDLGFDSLMLVELAGAIREAMPGAAEIPRALWVSQPTVAQLLDALGAEATMPTRAPGPLRQFRATLVAAGEPPRASAANARVIMAEDAIAQLRAASTDEPLLVLERGDTLTPLVLSLAQERAGFLRHVDLGEEHAAAVAAREQTLAGPAAVTYRNGERLRVAYVASDAAADPLVLSTQDVVLITGGLSEFSLAIARELETRAPVRIALLGRGEANAEAEREIAALGAIYVRADVRDANATARAVAQVRAAVGPPTLLIHAATARSDAPFARQSQADFADAVATKRDGLRHVVAAMGAPRAVLLTSSWAAAFGNHSQTAYATANAWAERELLALPRGVALRLPPIADTGLAKTIPPFVLSELIAQGLEPLPRAIAARAAVDAMCSAPAGIYLAGTALPADAEPHSDFTLDAAAPLLDHHRLCGVATLPLAGALDLFVRARAIAAPLALHGVEVCEGVQVHDTQTVTVRGSDALSLTYLARGHEHLGFRAHLGAPRGAPLAAATPAWQTPTLSLEEFYARHTFHGAALRGIVQVTGVSDAAVSGIVRVSHAPTLGPFARWYIDPLVVDASLQLALYWAQHARQQTALPIAIEEIAWLRAPADRVRCELTLTSLSANDFSGTILYYDERDDDERVLIGWMRNVRGKLLPREASPIARVEIPRAHYEVTALPQYVELRQRLDAAALSGLQNPYFNLHERVTNNTSLVGGREMLNYASYNYLGLSGDARISGAAKRAIDRYGTSVSASRIASGEKPLHRELEASLADFLGCEDAIVMVGGYVTNVTTIGHLFGPGDLVLHDTLIHDSVMQGIKLSGAARRPFPHNDAEALERSLEKLRAHYQRVLIVAEGAYSMDGDLGDLPAFIALRDRHKCFLLVDEAHSLGVVGKTGRGVGEHFNVDRRQVDMWMGTLSKSLASCGGYIAGSHALIELLKYTAPGFVYSVGISPPNAAASLAALEIIASEPKRVHAVQRQAAFFLREAHRLGLDTGMSRHTAVVPIVVGNSFQCIQLAGALFARGINVQPIIYPAVEDHAARLRFFVTALHTEEQLRFTACAIREALDVITGSASAQIR